MKVAIVNDQEMVVELLKNTLQEAIGHEVVWTAVNGQEAVEKCRAQTPDLILMDLMMPVMNGVEATRRIMAENPCSILIVTSSVNTSAGMVFEAMGHGAIDALNTSSFTLSSPAITDMLQRKLANIERLVSQQSEGKSTQTHDKPDYPLITIGSSTGGPSALATVLGCLPADLSATVTVIQHVDEDFSTGLADWLDAQIPMKVRIAREGDTPAAGEIRLAGTNNHLILDNQMCLRYTRHPVNHVYRPSVDVFFESAGMNWNGPIIGVLLTGMGNDGARGLKLLRDMGMHTIAQNEDTCSVFGMPKAAIKTGAVCEVLPLEAIGPAILDALNKPDKKRLQGT